MFFTGAWLRSRFSELEGKAREATQGSVWVEECIAVPAFGQIVVRFQTDTPVTLELVDRWERHLQGLAGDEFMIDFMGNVYRQIGVDYGRLDQINEKLARQFADEPMVRGPYAEQIQRDAEELLRTCGLSEDLPVWEIQYEGGEYSLLLLGKGNRFVRTVQGERPIHILEADETLCRGLQQAVFAAKRTGVSLGRLLLEALEA